MSSYLILRNWINIDKINFNLLSLNPNAIDLLKINKDKINWHYLSCNPNAISILKDNVNYDLFSFNPAIFTYDYKKIKEDFKDLGEEIVAKALHPDRLFKLMDVYDKNDVYNCYFKY